MKNKLHRKKSIITFAAAAALTVGVTMYGSSVTVWATPASGTSVSDNIVVRQSAVDGTQVGSLTEGQAVSIEDETTGSDGYTWYQISYTVDGSERIGWVRGDLLNTSDESLVTEDADSDGSDASGTGDGESVSLVFETQSGTITLTDIPEDELALVSERFVDASLDFSEGTITALQLAEPDELVSDDASIVDYYYVYGYNEIGETGWYVYNVDDGTIQKSLLNMQYSIPDTEDEESDNTAAFSVDSLTRMLISALGVVCLLLLILAIAFSVRYRRLRRILEEELDEEDYEEPIAAEKKKKEEPKPEERKRKKKKQEPEPAKVNKGQKPKEPVRAKQQPTGAAQEEDVHRPEDFDAEEYGRGTEPSVKDTDGQKAEDVYGQDADNLSKNIGGKTSQSESDTPKVKKSRNTAENAGEDSLIRENDASEKRRKKARKQNSARVEEAAPEPTTEVMGVDIMDLDSMDDTDYEALLNRYLEEDLAAGEDGFDEEASAGKAAAEDKYAGNTVAKEDSVGENLSAGNTAAENPSAERGVSAGKVSYGNTAEMSVENEELPEDDYDIPLETGDDYDIPDTGESDIIDLSKLRMPDEEPEFYDDDDDDDDDLTFL